MCMLNMEVKSMKAKLKFKRITGGCFNDKNVQICILLSKIFQLLNFNYYDRLISDVHSIVHRPLLFVNSALYSTCTVEFFASWTNKRLDNLTKISFYLTSPIVKQNYADV